MSILILEDSPTRIRSFRQGFIGASTAVITSAPMAISWLKDHTPRLVCLDYDLDQYGGSLQMCGTGLDVVRFIAEEAKRFEKTLVIVHSLNEKGRERMVNILQRHKISVSLHPSLWEEQANMHRLMRFVRDCDNSTVITDKLGRNRT
jgi:hypothetical protein